jgi:uncharacterized NAD(P)/FAD-binding protein YdhS
MARSAFFGLDVSLDGALIDRDGTISQSLFAVGPALKGSRWESVPELRGQIHKLVQHLVNLAAQPESTDSALSETSSALQPATT